jgi:hypothetical protein
MRMSAIASTCILACLCSISDCSRATDVADVVYDYHSISDSTSSSGRIRFDSRDGTIVYPAVYVSYDNCSTSEFFCIESPKLSFCVPKGDVPAESWICGQRNVSYRNNGLLELPIFGRTVPLMVIATEGVDYYYNKEFGVVMFRIKGLEQLEEAYWSASVVGLGASGTLESE